MRVLVGCEFSGRVRDSFIRLGHQAISCDFLPTERPGPHYQGDVRDLLHESWDLGIFFPSCTYLCRSGLHWNHCKGHKRYGGKQTEEALEFVRMLMGLSIPRIAIENPVGKIGTAIRPADQILQPYDFGHDASKKTCLWLKNLPPLQPTIHIPPRIVEDGPFKGLPRWGNQTDSGNNNVPGKKNQAKERSETYWGIAEAMARTWGVLG